MAKHLFWSGKACGAEGLRVNLFGEPAHLKAGFLLDEVYPDITATHVTTYDPAGYLASCQPDVDGAISSDEVDENSDYHVYTPQVDADDTIFAVNDKSPASYNWSGDKVQAFTYAQAYTDGSTNVWQRGGVESSYSAYFGSSLQLFQGPVTFRFNGITPSESGEIAIQLDNSAQPPLTYDGLYLAGTTYATFARAAYPDPVDIVGWQAHSTLSSPTVVHTEPSGWEANETVIIATERWNHDMVVLYTAVADGSDFEIVLIVMKWNPTTEVLDVKDTFYTGMIAPGAHLTPMGPHIMAEYIGGTSGDHVMLVGFPFWNGGSKTDQGQIRAYTIDDTTGIVTYDYTFDTPVPARNGHFGAFISTWTIDVGTDTRFSAGQIDSIYQIYGEGTSKGTAYVTQTISKSNIGQSPIAQLRNGHVTIDQDLAYIKFFENSVYVQNGSALSSYTLPWSGFHHGVNAGNISNRDYREGNWKPPSYAATWFCFMTDSNVTNNCVIMLEETAINGSDSFASSTIMSGSGVIEPHSSVVGTDFREQTVIVDNIGGYFRTRPMGRVDQGNWLPFPMGSTHLITTEHTSAQMLYDPTLGDIIVNFGRLATDTTKICYDVFKTDWNATYDATSPAVFQPGEAYAFNTTGIPITTYGEISFANCPEYSTVPWADMDSKVKAAVFYGFDGVNWSYDKSVTPQYSIAECFADHMDNGDFATMSTRMVGTDVSAETTFHLLFLMKADGIAEGSADWSVMRYFQYMSFKMLELPQEQEVMLEGSTDHPYVTGWGIELYPTEISGSNIYYRMYYDSGIQPVQQYGITAFGWPSRLAI